MHQFKQHSILLYHQKLKHIKMKVILLLAAMAATAFGEQTCYQGWDMHVRYFHRLSHMLLKANVSTYFPVLFSIFCSFNNRGCIQEMAQTDVIVIILLTKIRDSITPTLQLFATEREGNKI